MRPGFAQLEVQRAPWNVVLRLMETSPEVCADGTG